MGNFDFSREIWGGGNDGLMESEENKEPFPSPPTALGNPAKNADSHIPTARLLLITRHNVY
jgi:hypothetical protein